MGVYMNYTDILQQLISIDTTVPPGLNYEKAIDFLQPLFEEYSFETERVIIPLEHAGGREGRVNLICHRRNPGRPRVIFYGHVDVVPAQGWNAFSPRVEDGKIFGRGAADMKGSIVGLLYGLDLIHGKSFKYDVSIMMTTDEENGQSSQLRYLKPYLEPVFNTCFFNLDTNFGYVTITNLGAIKMDVKVHGKSVHSSLSHLGENAVEKANLVVCALMGLKEKVLARESAIPVDPDTGIIRMIPRLNINKMNGGLKSNIVPDECLISIDRRLIPEENITDAREEILETLSSVPGVVWEIVEEFGVPPIPPVEDPMIDELDMIIREINGKSGKYGMMASGGLPQIVSEWGGKTFGLGVIRPESNIHGKDEFVYQSDIENLAKIISRFLVS
jgi:succinyl-diaminopimelate desuccinylase